MKSKFYTLLLYCAAMSILVLFLLYAGVSRAFAESSPENEIFLAANGSDSHSLNEELFMEESFEDTHQIENLIRHSYSTMPRTSYLQINGFFKNYMPADGSNTYYSTPFSFRTNIAKDTDWWAASDLITKQYPNLGVNDIVTGLKWNFKKGNPSMAILGGAQLNTAGGNVGDHAFEPQAGILVDYRINSKWQTSFNILYKYLWDSTASLRYNQYNYVNETYYILNERQKVSAGFIANCPNASPAIPKGVNVTKVFAGYFWNTKEDLHYSIHVAKGLSFVDINWAILAGVGISL